MKDLFVKTGSFLCAVSFLLACTAEDGETGPQGPPGADGQDGNANVNTVLIENSSFINGSKKFNLSQINQDILDYGAVIVYMRVSDSDIWYALPYTFGSTVVKVLYVRLNEITIVANYDSTASVDFKFVIIAGNNANAGLSRQNSILSSLKNNGIDPQIYEDIADYYNLEQRNK